jgi:hypothetical protein
LKNTKKLEDFPKKKLKKKQNLKKDFKKRHFGGVGGLPLHPHFHCPLNLRQCKHGGWGGSVGITTFPRPDVSFLYFIFVCFYFLIIIIIFN